MQTPVFGARLRAAIISCAAMVVFACGGAESSSTRPGGGPEEAGLYLSGFRAVIYKAGAKSSEIMASQTSLQHDPAKLSLKDVTIQQLKNGESAGRIQAGSGVYFLDASPAEDVAQGDVKLLGEVFIEGPGGFHLTTSDALYRSELGQLTSSNHTVLETATGGGQKLQATGQRFEMRSNGEGDEFILQKGPAERATASIKPQSETKAPAPAPSTENGF